jgi:hypothetical protein
MGTCFANSTRRLARETLPADASHRRLDSPPSPRKPPSFERRMTSPDFAAASTTAFVIDMIRQPGAAHG